MAEPGITVDFSSGLRGLKELTGITLERTRDALGDVGEDLLRRSREEVPHDKGPLSQSGVVDRSELPTQNPTVKVGYNKVYAARLHEHPEYSFQKGRKGKYLEDPLKNNLRTFTKYIADFVRRSL